MDTRHGHKLRQQRTTRGRAGATETNLGREAEPAQVKIPTSGPYRTHTIERMEGWILQRALFPMDQPLDGYRLPATSGIERCLAG